MKRPRSPRPPGPRILQTQRDRRSCAKKIQLRDRSHRKVAVTARLPAAGGPVRGQSAPPPSGFAVSAPLLYGPLLAGDQSVKKAYESGSGAFKARATARAESQIRLDPTPETAAYV